MGRAAAIAAKCKDCIYDPYERGSWRKQVENCPIPDCALYPYRPLPVGSENSQKTGQK